MTFKRLQDIASFIITGVVISILALMMFVVIRGSDNWKDTQIWIDAGFNTLLQVIMIATWLPEGKKRGEQDEVFQANRRAANAAMRQAAEPDKFNALIAFCAKTTAENREAWIAKRVARHGVVYTQWKACADYRKQFDDRTATAVQRAERRAAAAVEDIKATEIVTNSDINLVYDTKDHTDSLTAWNVAGKVVLSIALCAVGAFIRPEAAAFTLSSLLSFAYWLLVMFMSIFYALRTGSKLITDTRNDYFKRIIVFLQTFHAWAEKGDALDQWFVAKSH